MKIYHNLHFTTTPQNHFFPSVPHTYFATKFRTNFNFIEVFTDNKPDICATIIQNTSKHVATLPSGHIGYIEVPITNEKPKFFQVNDINTLKHNVTHTYHPETLTRRPIYKIDTVLHLEIDLAMTKVLLLHNTLDHDMILTNVILGLTALHTDLRTNLLIDTTLVLDIDHALIQETLILQNIQIHKDHFLNQEILDFLDPVHTPILEIKSI